MDYFDAAESNTRVAFRTVLVSDNPPDLLALRDGRTLIAHMDERYYERTNNVETTSEELNKLTYNYVLSRRYIVPKYHAAQWLRFMIQYRTLSELTNGVTCSENVEDYLHEVARRGQVWAYEPFPVDVLKEILRYRELLEMYAFDTPEDMADVEAYLKRKARCGKAQRDLLDHLARSIILPPDWAAKFAIGT